MMHEQVLETGGVALHYAEGPAGGPPLVLLHGGSARWQSWEPLIDDFATTMHVFAPDLRGHGRSSWLAPHYRLLDYTADIVALLEQRVPQPAIVFGHSLGGMVALLAAAQRPDLVRAVIAGDSPLSSASWLAALHDSHARLCEWHDLATRYRTAGPIIAALKDSPIEVPGQAESVPARAVFGEESPWFAWMASNLSQLDPATLAILLSDAERAATDYELEPVMRSVQCPVLLLQADPAAGALMSDAEVAVARRTSPHVTHTRLDGVSHALHATHPAIVREAVAAFVRQISSLGRNEPEG